MPCSLELDIILGQCWPISLGRSYATSMVDASFYVSLQSLQTSAPLTGISSDWFHFHRLHVCCCYRTHCSVHGHSNSWLGWRFRGITISLRYLVRSFSRYIVYLLICTISHGIFIDPIVWVVAAEIFPSHLRAYGTGIAIAGVTAVDILWLQLAPTAARTIGWKYYLVFIALGIVHAVYFYFFLPEVSPVQG